MGGCSGILLWNDVCLSCPHTRDNFCACWDVRGSWALQVLVQGAG